MLDSNKSWGRREGSHNMGEGWEEADTGKGAQGRPHWKINFK